MPRNNFMRYNYAQIDRDRHVREGIGTDNANCNNTNKTQIWLIICAILRNCVCMCGCLCVCLCVCVCEYFSGGAAEIAVIFVKYNLAQFA